MSEPTVPWEACWPEDRGRLIVADVAAQDDKVLLAAHQPPVMRRSAVPLPGQRLAVVASAEDATQEELLNHLVFDEPPEGTLVVPIIGAPGTGKSHLIRWLRAAIPDNDDLIVRHVPREGTSLPDVVRILLEGLGGAEFERLAQNMDAARSNITSMDQAATRLVLRIAELVQHGLPFGWRRAASLSEEMRASLCARTVLPALLTDATMREQLTRQGGPVYQLAHDIVNGYSRPPGDDDDELGFRVDDLTFKSPRGMGRHATLAAVALKLPGHADAAAKILSDALDVAAADVIGLSSASMSNILQNMRAELLAQGKQLLLMFEDIAIARGLEQDLFDAIATPAIREGERRLCTLRVALAVTNDHWDQRVPETLATRVSSWGGQMFSLDSPTADASSRSPDLIARYLNVARIGASKVKEMDVRSIATRGVPNACDTCPFDRQPECHATFGATAAGHGLFPLTHEAAKNLSMLADSAARPRMVLSEVAAPTIGDRDALNAWKFPSPGRLRELVSAGVERRAIREIAIEQARELEAADLVGDARERAETLLAAWFGEGSDSGVLSALGLPRITIVTSQTSSATRTTTSSSTTTRTTEPRDPAVDRRIAEVNDWATGRTPLSPVTARLIRRALFNEIRAGVRWDEFAASREGVLDALGIRGSDQTMLNLTIRVANSGGGGATGTAEPLVDLDTNVANAELMRGLVLREHHSSFDFPDGASALARLRLTVAATERRIIERLRANQFSRQRMTDAAQLVLLSAAPLANETGADDSSDLMQALVDLEERGPTAGRSRSWQALLVRARVAQSRAVRALSAGATRSQGETGAPTIIDPTLIDERALTRDPGGIKNGLTSDDLSGEHAGLIAEARQALTAETTELETLVEAIEVHTGRDASLALKTIRDAVLEAVSAAEASHVRAGSFSLDEIREMPLPTSMAAAALLEDARRVIRLARGQLTLDALARCARLDAGSLQRIRAFLDASDDVIGASTKAASEHVRHASGGSTSSVTATTRAAIADFLANLEAMA